MIRIRSSAENGGNFLYLLLAGCFFFIYSIYCARTEIFHIHSDECKPEPNYKPRKVQHIRIFANFMTRTKISPYPKNITLAEYICNVHSSCHLLNIIICWLDFNKVKVWIFRDVAGSSSYNIKKIKYTVKKAYRFSRPQPGSHKPNSPYRRELFNYSWPGRVWLVTSMPRTGKSITFFYSVGKYQR
jgi:hypothetical protein